MDLQGYLGREFGVAAERGVSAESEAATEGPEASRGYYRTLSHIQGVYSDSFGERPYIGDAEDGAALVLPIDMGVRQLGDHAVRVFAQPTVRNGRSSTLYGLDIAAPYPNAQPPYSAENCPSLFRRLEVGEPIGPDGPAAEAFTAVMELAELYDEVAAAAALEG